MKFSCDPVNQKLLYWSPKGRISKPEGPNIQARKAESESSYEGTVRSLPTI